ncbi:MAG: hypothetical protein FWE13_01005 [Firmicutes bacterium]|nr:hypothetical protein [Bacillota bacterium]
MANKITKFSIDTDYFFKKALEKSENGDLVGALELLRHLQNNILYKPKIDKDVDIRLEIADVFMQMGLINEAFRELLKLSGLDYYLDEVFFGLIKCSTLKENPLHASYYIKLGLEKGYFDDEDDEDSFDLNFLQEMIRPYPKRKFEVLSPQDNSRIVDMAKNLLYSMDTALAREMLTNIPSDSHQYIEAMNYLAVLEISEGRASEGIALCDKILALKLDDIYAITTKIAGLHYLKRYAERDELIGYLDEFDIDTWADVSKIALMFCQINNSSLAFKYLERCLKFMPYEREFLVLKMLASANLGNKKIAKDTAVLLLNIYPDDSVALYYAKDIDIADSDKAYNLIPELPQHIRMLYSKLLDDSFIRAESSNDFVAEIQNNPQLKQAAKYAMQTNNSAIAGKLGAFLASSSNGIELVRDYLSDINFPVGAKKEIFVSLVKKVVSKKLHIILGHQILWHKIKVPTNIKDSMLKNAYAEVYGTMLFLTELEPKKLIKEANAMLAVLEKNGITVIDFNDNAVASVLAKRVSNHKLFSTTNSICDVFGITVEEFEKAEDVFS